MATSGQVNEPAQPAKKKRALPAALAAFKIKKGEKLQKGQRRSTTTAASAASSETTITAGAVTVRRHDSVLSWMGL